MVIKQINLIQISTKLFLILMKNIHGYLLQSVIDRIKKTNGQWNPALKNYQIQITYVQVLWKQLNKLDADFSLQEVATDRLLKIIAAKQQIDDKKQKKIHYITSQKKWARIMLYDPYLAYRFSFVQKFIHKKKCDKNVRKVRKWNWFLEPCWGQLEIKQLSSYQLMDHNKKQIHLLTYQRMDISNIQNIIGKYNCVICDEMEHVIAEQQSEFIRSSCITKSLQQILYDKYSPDGQLVLIMTKLPLIQPRKLIDMFALLRVKQLGINREDHLNWMSKRYLRKSHYTKELFYILSCTVLIFAHHDSIYDDNNSSHSKSIAYNQNITDHKSYHINWIKLGQESIQKFKKLDQKYRRISCKQLLNNFHSNKILNNSQKKYLSDIRTLMNIQKLPFLLKLIYGWSKQIGLRLALVIHCKQLQNKIEKFLSLSQISFIRYDLNYDQKDGIGYDRFNLNNKIKICIINIEQIFNQYNEKSHQYNSCYSKNIENSNSLDSYELTNTNFGHFSQFKPIVLKKLSTIKHIIYVDTFWYDFCTEREKILQSIFDRDTKVVQNYQSSSYTINVRKQINIHHYILCKGSYEKIIWDKYEIFRQQIIEEQQLLKKTQKKNKKISLEDFQKNIIKNIELKYKKFPKILGVYDIDEEFDKLQFEERQEKKKKQNKFIMYEGTNNLSSQKSHVSIQTPFISQINKNLKKKLLKAEQSFDKSIDMSNYLVNENMQQAQFQQQKKQIPKQINKVFLQQKINKNIQDQKIQILKVTKKKEIADQQRQENLKSKQIASQIIKIIGKNEQSEKQKSHHFIKLGRCEPKLLLNQSKKVQKKSKIQLKSAVSNIQIQPKKTKFQGLRVKLLAYQSSLL